MAEKRKHKRVVMNTTITAAAITSAPVADNEPFDIDVFDISVGGLGFHADRLLPLDSFYNANVKLLSGESFQCVLKIVRGFGAGTYTYGAEFISLSPADEYRIELYTIILEHNPDMYN